MIAFVAVVALVIWYAAGSKDREERAYQDQIKKQQHYDKIHATTTPMPGIKNKPTWLNSRFLRFPQLFLEVF
jgi:hypothetical protein